MGTVMVECKYRKKKPKLLRKLEGNLLFISLISLLWFLFRTGRKPSRIVYPCQQAALAQFSSYFIAFFPLATIKGMIRSHEKGKINLKSGLRIVSLVILTCLIAGTGSMKREQWLDVQNAEMFEFHVGHPPIGPGFTSTANSFFGTAEASQFDEHKVVSIYDSDATNWDYATGYYWDYVDQDVVNIMMARGVMALTGESNVADAWRALIPYQPGESIAIKLNFNNSWSCDETDNDIDALPEPVNAIIDGLTSIGVPPDKIWIFDASRLIPNRFIERINNPDVGFYSAISWHTCIGNYHHTSYVDPDSPETSGFSCTQGNLPQDVIRPAQVLVDADHLINIPIFKSHGSYVTLALKNHYGSVMYDLNDRSSMHAYFEQSGNSAGCTLETEHVLADINNNPNIRDKTRLIVGDGLFGNPHTNWKETERWTIFGNDDPNILFFSTDPVAISSVMTDYIMEERGWQGHEMLHAAAHLGLGVHEHWDSFESKQYTAIDYVEINLDEQIIVGDVNGDGQVNFQDIQACLNHVLGFQDWGEAADVNEDGHVNALDVQTIINIFSGE
jgi:hypothetical protein